MLHVALHIVFKDKASHDKYQDAQRYRKFIAENKENRKKARVFDSIIRQQRRGAVPRPFVKDG